MKHSNSATDHYYSAFYNKFNVDFLLLAISNHNYTFVDDFDIQIHLNEDLELLTNRIQNHVLIQK